MELKAALPTENSKLNCYLRLTGVTPRSHLCDITVTSGDGNEVIKISGWEEITDRVPQRYCEMILQPATSFITESLSSEALGNPATDVSSALVTDVPYPLFEKDEEFWLKIMSHVVLNHPERKEFSEMSGSTRRRTEWLFGRIAAKEAVRRYLKDFYQARWSYADVQIWPDANGKPIAIGDWNRYLLTRLDIAIAHTSQFVIAVAAANARVGVDVESVSRDLSDEFARGVFIGEELDLAASTSNPSQAIIRFWCAKEAVSKALGTGIRYSPREMVVTSYLADTGDVTMKLTGAWEEAFKELKGKDIRISTRIMRDHALAFCFIPNSLFPSEGE
jgi:phosphopantetheine--protein transferase-like protein